jgi:glycerol-3-phosphate acyltransferase PlsX
MKIGVDLMGGDYAPDVVLQGIQLAVNEIPEHISLVLYGSIPSGTQAIFNHKSIEWVESPEVVGMTDHPTRVLATKPKSSLVMGITDMKNGRIDGFCSAGNTGALLVAGMYIVNAIPGVIRPCIASLVPEINGATGLILDIGANADCKPDVLYQFAILGSLYAQKVLNINKPRVALLNIGEEEEKGNLLAQASYRLLKESHEIHFTGNVEGRDLFTGKADVIVCDGFTGNVVLKQAEAMYTLFKKREVHDDFLDRFNYELYGGTPVLGINGNIIIGHGNSSPLAIKNMIKHTIEVADSNLQQHFKNAFKP